MHQSSPCGGKGYPLNTGVTKGGGLPYITIGAFGGGLGNHNGGRPMGTGPSPYLDFQDSVSYLRGKHALKFGAEITHIEADQDTTDFRGIQINFNGGLTPGRPRRDPLHWKTTSPETPNFRICHRRQREPHDELDALRRVRPG